MIEPRGHHGAAVAPAEIEHDRPGPEPARVCAWGRARQHRADIRLVGAPSEPVRHEQDVLARGNGHARERGRDVDRDDACQRWRGKVGYGSWERDWREMCARTFVGEL